MHAAGDHWRRVHFSVPTGSKGTEVAEALGSANRCRKRYERSGFIPASRRAWCRGNDSPLLLRVVEASERRRAIALAYSSLTRAQLGLRLVVRHG